MIIIAGTMTIDPTKADDFMEAAKELMRATHAEEGCLAYAFSRDPLDDAVIHIFEKWESQEILDTHMQMKHYQKFGSQIGNFGVTGADVKKYTGATEGSLF